MANNYLQFSEVLSNLTDAEEKWLYEQLEYVPIEVESGDSDTSRTCPRFMLDMPEMDPDYAETNFSYEFEDDEASDSRYLWLYTEESGDPDHAAYLVHKFLKQFHPNDCWSLTYATTCSKMRIGEFGGGGVFVTAKGIRYSNAYDFVEQERAAFTASQAATSNTPSSVDKGDVA